MKKDFIKTLIENFKTLLILTVVSMVLVGVVFLLAEFCRDVLVFLTFATVGVALLVTFLSDYNNYL